MKDSALTQVGLVDTSHVSLVEVASLQPTGHYTHS